MSINPNDSSDPRNMIRICPQGRKFDIQKEIAYKFVKHVFEYVEGKLKCKTNHVPAQASHENEEFNSNINRHDSFILNW
jgi:hypothetical protein